MVTELTLEQSERALRSTAVAAVSSRDVVVVDGPEAASYLQGQMSQNVERLAEGSSAWSLLLEPTGRVTSWCRITRLSPELFWIDTDPGAGEPTLERLERFKLRTKATFELRPAVPMIAVRGPLSPSAADMAPAVGEGCVAIDLEWPGAIGVDLLGVDPGEFGEVLASRDIPVGPPAIAEVERVESGRPAMGHEFGEKTIPAETGIVDQSADFTKGCYVGQELVARVDSRGNNTPRTVHPVRLAAGNVPSVGDELWVDGSPVGVFTSVASASGHVAGLASIKRGTEIPTTATVEIDGEQVSAEISTVHWS